MVENKKFFIKFINPIFMCTTYLFLYLPTIVLAVFSFNNSKVPSRWTGFSIKWYKALLYNQEILEAFKVSIIVAVSATFLSIILGTCFVITSKWWKTNFLFYEDI